MKIPIGLADDHQLFLKSLGMMLEGFGEYEVVAEALNGSQLKQQLLQTRRLPEIMLLDVNMPVMNGIDTCRWLNNTYPAMKLVALSMNDNDHSVISMFKAGCCAYLLKDTHPIELEKALKEIRTRGYYNADSFNINFRRIVQLAGEKKESLLTVRELEFLRYACTDMTYKQIAAEMNLAERTVDGYRESLFEKFHVQSRVGLCMEALRKGYLNL